MPKKIVILIVFALCSIAVTAAGCLSDTEYSGEGSSPQTKKLTILSHEIGTTSWGGISVTGIARNDSDGRLGYAEVKVRFYDVRGSLLETSFANVLDLDPGQTWSFEVLSFKEGPSRYEIGIGTLWD